MVTLWGSLCNIVTLLTILTFPLQLLPDPSQRIVKIIHDPFLQRDDPVVGDLNVLRANFRATFGDVAVADPVRRAQFFEAILGIERMHLERGGVNEKARADEFVVLAMVAQDVADVLAKEALDTFPEF